MLTARLAHRVPSVRPCGAATLSGHRLYFHLLGEDGSGKCNVLHTGHAEDRVHGVLFELDSARLERLHAAEGPPYAFLQLDVATAGKVVRAAIYRGRAGWLDDTLKPFEWYRAFVLAGAREHDLPADYIAHLAGTPAVRDPDRARAAANRALLDEKPGNVRGG